MTQELQQALVNVGAFSAFGMSAIGSAYGCGVAASSAIGSWKKCYAQGRPVPFQLTILTGAPMTQTIYGVILMGQIMALGLTCWPEALIIGLIGGLGICFSAMFQGRAAAGGCDAFAETGQGFVNYLIALGIVETIAIFVLAFGIKYIGDVTKAAAAIAGA
ncbi:MAG: V-type ATP synthase subunit K [Lentisphaeria bacterium]